MPPKLSVTNQDHRGPDQSEIYNTGSWPYNYKDIKGGQTNHKTPQSGPAEIVISV